MKEDNYHLGIKAIIINKKHQILLLKVDTSSFGKSTKKPYWDIPGGRVQRGDDVEQTLLRELQEETGITKVLSFKPFSMVLSNIRIPIDGQDVGLILAAYICEVDDTNKIKLSGEHTEYNWFNKSEAAELLKVKYPDEFIDNLESLVV